MAVTRLGKPALAAAVERIHAARHARTCALAAIGARAAIAALAVVDRARVNIVRIVAECRRERNRSDYLQLARIAYRTGKDFAGLGIGHRVIPPSQDLAFIGRRRHGISRERAAVWNRSGRTRNLTAAGRSAGNGDGILVDIPHRVQRCAAFGQLVVCCAQLVGGTSAVGLGIPALERIIRALQGGSIGQREKRTEGLGHAADAARAAIRIEAQRGIRIGLEHSLVRGRMQDAVRALRHRKLRAVHARRVLGIDCLRGHAVLGSGGIRAILDQDPLHEVVAGLGGGHGGKLRACRRTGAHGAARNGAHLVNGAVDRAVSVGCIDDLDDDLFPLRIQRHGFLLGIRIHRGGKLSVLRGIRHRQAGAIALRVPSGEFVAMRSRVQIRRIVEAGTAPFHRVALQRARVDWGALVGHIGQNVRIRGVVALSALLVVQVVIHSIVRVLIPLRIQRQPALQDGQIVDRRASGSGNGFSDFGIGGFGRERQAGAVALRRPTGRLVVQRVALKRRCRVRVAIGLARPCKALERLDDVGCRDTGRILVEHQLEGLDLLVHDLDDVVRRVLAVQNAAFGRTFGQLVANGAILRDLSCA